MAKVKATNKTEAVVRFANSLLTNLIAVSWKSEDEVADLSVIMSAFLPDRHLTGWTLEVIFLKFFFLLQTGFNLVLLVADDGVGGLLWKPLKS